MAIEFRTLPDKLKDIGYDFMQVIADTQVELLDAKQKKNNVSIDTIVQEMVEYADRIRDEIDAAEEGTSEQKAYIKNMFEQLYDTFNVFVNNLKAGEVEATIQAQKNEAAQGQDGGKRRKRRSTKKVKKTKKAKKTRKARKTRRHH